MTTWRRIPGYLQKHKPERLAISQNLRRQATEIASIKTESTENYTKLQGNNSVSESLGRTNIPSDEHAMSCIYWDKWAFLYKNMFRSEKSKLLSIHRLRSFFWQGLKESVDIFAWGPKNSIHRCYRRTTVGRSGQRYKFPNLRFGQSGVWGRAPAAKKIWCIFDNKDASSITKDLKTSSTQSLAKIILWKLVYMFE